MGKSRVDVLERDHSAGGVEPDHAPMRDFAHSLPMALLRAREAVMGCFRPLLQRNGVTEQQWRIIRALSQGGETEISELARRCHMLPPSISGVLKRMEIKGLVRRAADEADHRRSLISLTTSARRMFAEVAQHSETRYDEIEAAFGIGRMRALYALLAELETVCEDLAAREPRRTHDITGSLGR